MLKSRCGVSSSVKEARKEWHPAKEVLNSANIEGRDRRGLIQLPNSIRLHGARGLKVQIPKGTKEHQVKKGTKFHFKSPTAETRHILCVGVGGDRTHAGPPKWSRVFPP